eukprot:408946_1
MEPDASPISKGIPPTIECKVEFEDVESVVLNVESKPCDPPDPATESRTPSVSVDRKATMMVDEPVNVDSRPSSASLSPDVYNESRDPTCLSGGRESDVVALVIFAAAALVDSVVTPRMQLVTNGDPRLSYPFVGSTVPTWLLILLIVVVPLTGFSVIYALDHRTNNRARDNFVMSMSYVWQAISTTFFITSVLKAVVGQPRPNFFAMCEWDADAEKCTAESFYRRHEARRSFPSGHASLSFASLGFVSLFLLYRLVELDGRPRFLDGSQRQWILPKVLLSFSPIFLAFFVSISRIFDHYHSASDVTAGAVLGLSIAAIFCRILQKSLKNRGEPRPRSLRKESVPLVPISGISAV